MEIILDILLDTIKMVPLIVITYFILDIYERNTNVNTKLNLILSAKTGPIFGALIGCVPQCGFAFLGATLFVHDIITPGTMIAVFIATSDEALPMLIANPSEYKSLLLLVIVKIIFAIFAGYLFDFGFKHIVKRPLPQFGTYDEEIEDEDEEGEEIVLNDPSCTCGNTPFQNVVRRTLRVIVFVLIVNTIFSIIMELFGSDVVTSFLQKTYIYQPFLTALFGFIPSCAISIIFTELFLMKGLSFGALIAGLSVNAGIGILQLVKEHKYKKEIYAILIYMYAISVIVGYVLTLIVH